MEKYGQIRWPIPLNEISQGPQQITSFWGTINPSNPLLCRARKILACGEKPNEQRWGTIQLLVGPHHFSQRTLGPNHEKEDVKIYSKPLLIVHAFFCNLEQLVFLYSVLGVLLHNFCADDLAHHALSLAESCFAESNLSLALPSLASLSLTCLCLSWLDLRFAWGSFA